MIIGLVGKAGAGKDTVFEIIHDLWESKHLSVEGKKLERVYHQEFKNVKFAGKVKEVCSLLTNYPIETFFDRSKYNIVIPELGVTIRELMQNVGEGLRIEVSNDIWVIAAFQKVTSNHNVVVTDVRYPNEIACIKDKNGILIKIYRPRYEESTIVGKQANHSSEISLDSLLDENYDYVITNDGTLDDLIVKVKLIMDEIWK